MTDRLELRLREQLLAFVADPTGAEDRIPNLFEARFPAEAAVFSPATQERHLEAIRSRLSASSNSALPPWLRALLLPRRLVWPIAALACAAAVVVLVLSLQPNKTKDQIVVAPPGPVKPVPQKPSPKGPVVKIRELPSPQGPPKERIVDRKPTPPRPHQPKPEPRALVAAKVKVGKFGEQVMGEPTWRVPGMKAPEKVLPNAPLYAGATIETGDMDKAEIRFADGTTFVMDFNTTVLLPPSTGGAVVARRPEEITLTSGRVSVVAVHAADSAPFAVKTPVATATVVGTKFSLRLQREGATDASLKAVLQVREGRVAFSNALGSEVAGPRTESTATRQTKPSVPKRITTLYVYQTSDESVSVITSSLRLGEAYAAKMFAYTLGYAGFEAVKLPEGEVLVSFLHEDSAANLRIGDRIRQLNGRTVTTAEEVTREIARAPDKRIALMVERNGEAVRVPINTVRGYLNDAAVPVGLEKRLDEATWPALSGDVDRALKQLLALSEKSPHPAVFNNLGVVYEMQDRMDVAIRSYHSAMALAPNVSIYRSNLGGALVKIGNSQRAVEEFRRALSLNPNSFGAFAGQLAPLRVLEWQQDLIALLEDQRPRFEHLSEYWLYRGQTLLQMGRADEAQEAIQKSLEINPNNCRTYGWLATILQGKRQYAEADKAQRQALKINPGSAGETANLAAQLNFNRRFAEAEPIARRAIALNPGHARAHAELGKALENTGRGEEAEAMYRKSIQLDPNKPTVYRNLGDFLLDRNRFREAEAAYRKLLEMQPTDTNSILNLSYIASLDGRTEEQEALVRKALEIRPDNANAHLFLANILVTKGNFAEAEALYRKGLELGPVEVEAYTTYAHLLEARSRGEQAESVYRDGLKALPDQPVLLNELAWHLAQRGVKLEEALDLAQRAVKGAPSDGGFRDTLGWVYYKRGEYNDAEAQLTKAIELFGKSPSAAEAWVHLGAVYEKKNEIEKAKDAYKKALAIQPNNKEAAEALKRLGPP